MNRALRYQQRFDFLQMLIEQRDMEYQLGHTVQHTTYVTTYACSFPPFKSRFGQTKF